ncbi:di-heme-cytochrome C peroxidase [Sphingomonas caeni]|uniref:di-heme-cytochrome C peroxidase n=1 Tax=Sphingomonas caeni TaxID=2984949 RepID=UPI0029F47B27|nr:di-heme-cytochrome C peroxidase [Sphingomonas caeni]
MAQAQVPCLPGSNVQCVNQGSAWTNNTRKDFYSRDQGSQMIPYAWAKALKTSDGQPFMGDGLARYGYLDDPFRNLPVGFTVAGTGVDAQLGMNCAACHTREITYSNLTFRVDGGPALVDFQGLLTDMVDAVGDVLNDTTKWTAFYKAVLGPAPSASKIAALRSQVEIWYMRENTMKERAYGTPNLWGLGRLDAVAMIFNRVTGLDLGPPPTYLIANNIQPADAPVRYPFLWNAAKQDRTQWPGFADNGTSVAGLARNTGEVFGVFGVVHPQAPSPRIGNVNFTAINSMNGWGLLALENLIKKIGTPKWPSHFPINTTLAAAGKPLYEANCGSCHGVKPGKPGFPNIPTWATPLQDVGTDSREYQVMARQADPGVLINLKTHLAPNFKVTNPSKSFDLLKYVVIGSVVQKGTVLLALAEDFIDSPGFKNGKTLAKAQQLTEDSFDFPDLDGTFKYESRVMFGIWAAAPYLHNGSVPTMWDLLKPASQRPVSFAVGPAYDPINMGLAPTQPGSYTHVTTGCEDRNSGNSRCGHEFGVNLSNADKRALIEYMKTL